MDLVVNKVSHRHGSCYCCCYVTLFGIVSWASFVAKLVKNPPAMQEMQVRSLGGEDPLEKEMATHSSTLAWKIPWRAEPCRLQSMQRVAKSWTRLRDFTSLHYSV